MPARRLFGGVLGICDFRHKTPRQSQTSLTWPKGPGFSGHIKLLLYFLEAKYFGIVLIVCHQLSMRSGFHNTPPVKGDDMIGKTDCRNSMGGNNNGSAVGHGSDGRDNVTAGFHIHLADGVVQDQNAGLIQQGTGQGNTLFLAERMTPFSPTMVSKPSEMIGWYHQGLLFGSTVLIPPLLHQH